MSTYTIRQGRSARHLADFLHLPWAVYRNDPNWVPPLTSEVKRTLDVRKNPFFSFAIQERFVCYRDDAPVARVIVVVDPKQRTVNERKPAFFGYFESEDDPKACQLLLEAAAQFAASQGATLLQGPFNPNHYSELGLKLDRFNVPPKFFETYNPSYYSALLEESGFRPAKQLRTFEWKGWPEPIRKHFLETPDTGSAEYRARTLRMSRLDKDLDEVRSVYNNAFADNPFFHEVSQAEYRFAAKFLRYVTEPWLNVLIEHRGKTVAVAQVMQDVNPLLRRLKGKAGPLKFLRYERDRKNLRSAVIYAIGVRKEYQRSYAMGLLIRHTVLALQDFDTISSTWVSEDNDTMMAFCRRLGFVPDRGFAIYQKELSND